MNKFKDYVDYDKGWIQKVGYTQYYSHMEDILGDVNPFTVCVVVLCNELGSLR